MAAAPLLNPPSVDGRVETWHDVGVSAQKRTVFGKTHGFESLFLMAVTDCSPHSLQPLRSFQVSLTQPFVCVLQIVLDSGFPLRVDLKRAEPGDDTVIACNRSPIVSSHLSLSLFFLSSLSLSLSPEVGAPVPTWRGARRMRSWLGSCETAG